MEQSEPIPRSGTLEGYNRQIVPPADGSLPQAWLAVATTLTTYRANAVAFAAWAGAATRQWVIVSLGAGLCLFWLNALVGSFFTQNTDPVTLHGLTRKDELILLLYPVRYLTAVLLIPLVVAVVTPRYFGRLGARFLRVMRPWSLAQVGMGVALVGWQLAKFAIVVATHGDEGILLQEILLLPQGLAGWYTVILSVSALAVGAYRRPWIIVVIGGIVYELIYAGFPLLTNHLALLLAIR